MVVLFLRLLPSFPCLACLWGLQEKDHLSLLHLEPKFVRLPFFSFGLGNIQNRLSRTVGVLCLKELAWQVWALTGEVLVECHPGGPAGAIQWGQWLTQGCLSDLMLPFMGKGLI
jgi:hypothetical protein